MKRMTLFLILAGSVLQIHAAPTSYVMHCMPGPGMRLELGLPGDALKLHFRPGKHGAGVEAVKPGTCTWSDRGLRSSEPRHFHHSGIGRPRVDIGSSNQVTRLASAKAPYLNHYFNNRLFQVHVYNSGRREWAPASFVVTKAGP